MINKNREQDPALNFEFLRAQGIALIQQYAGKNWSDFNLHDPGITILEYICYALTDVAYRTSFPIADILADRQGRVNREKNFFFSREEALSSGPVTVNDYRKLLIDAIPDVDNIWLEPLSTPYTALYGKGIYNVIIKPGPDFITHLQTTGSSRDLVQNLIQTVKETLAQYRNIGARYVSFRVLLPQPVYIRAEIILERNVSPEHLLVRVYEALEHTLNPPVTFYTEAELKARKYTIEEMYAGPLLQNGIIPDDELKERITRLDPFVLTKVIGGLEGIISIKNLSVSRDRQHFSTQLLTFEDPYFPYVSLDEVYPEIIFYQDNHPLYIQNQEVLKKELNIKRKIKAAGIGQKVPQPLPGDHKSLEEYISIQTLFPAIYDLGESGGKSNQSPAAIAKSRQLKAYLMLFEQLLANSLSQAARISDLFSTDFTPDNAATYHHQALYQVPDARYILKAFTDSSPTLSTYDWERFKNNPANAFMQAAGTFLETDDQYKDRKKRAFDHILARFNIAVHKHPLALYEFYYDQENPGRRIDLEISWKADILRNLDAFTSYRVKADNYLTLQEDEGLSSGFGKKMALLLHIKNQDRRKLSEVMARHQEQMAVSRPTAQNNPANPNPKKQLRSKFLDVVFDLDEPEIEEDSRGLTAHVTFKNQSEKLFQSAIDLGNYRIQPYTESIGEEAVLLFKHPQDTRWNRVSKHPDEYAAIQALQKTIRTFKDFSMGSEGFYVLEHVLLKPAPDAPAYGFNFTDCYGHKLLKQRSRQSFAQRENTITKLLALAESSGPDNPDLQTLLQETSLFRTEHTPQSPEQPGSEAVAYLLSNLRQFSRSRTDLYPAFEYTVNLAENQEIAEDFFNFRMTVVFPSWPARFQDKSFRQLAEEMFREECPAHMKISFLWLSLSQLKIFDNLYFNWIEALKTDENATQTQGLSQKLTRFLLEHGVTCTNISQA